MNNNDFEVVNLEYSPSGELTDKKKIDNTDSYKAVAWFYSFYILIVTFIIHKYILLFLVLYLFPPFDSLMRAIFPFLNIENNSKRKIQFGFLIFYLCFFVSALLGSEPIRDCFCGPIYLILIILLISFIPCLIAVLISKIWIAQEMENSDSSLAEKSVSRFFSLIMIFALFCFMLWTIITPLFMLALGGAGG